ncbi:MAG: hypothetical protein LBP87_06565, partial [Planctomycetaceae bacterium]|nr:hypothetical protein [Planctomycetaceae bacterium]
LVGCSKNCAVTGKVTLPDGTPLTVGKVVFETDTMVSTGSIQKDGTYKLGTLKQNDGAPRGLYRVYLTDIMKPTIEMVPGTDNNSPSKIITKWPDIQVPTKYFNGHSSGLVCEVKGRTVFDIKLE